MQSRRSFLKTSGTIALGSALIPGFAQGDKVKNVGIQLYSVRKELLTDAVGTLKQLAKIGYKELESARSSKGHYYGFTAKEAKKIIKDLGMNLRSGHVHLDDQWKKTVEEAVESGQEYLICSSLPSNGQTVSNYEKVADMFNKAGEDCKKANLKFGYHNHEYEFEKDGGKVLYDVLLEKTDPDLVNMELDLGWVILTGNDPATYFKKFPGRFPLWHLKDMDAKKKESTEFGKGAINIKGMMDNAKASGMKYFFVEQEEYTNTALESVKYDYDYLMKLKV